MSLIPWEVVNKNKTKFKTLPEASVLHKKEKKSVSVSPLVMPLSSLNTSDKGSRNKTEVSKKTVSISNKKIDKKKTDTVNISKKPKIVISHGPSKSKGKRENVSFSSRPPLPLDKSEVYILELSDSKIYVGKSVNITKRVSQHIAHQGAVWTQKYPPTGKMLPRLGNVSGDGDAAERDEFLWYVHQCGISRVRGWQYCNVHLSKDELRQIEENVRSKFNLCYRCGSPSHFAKNCKETLDRFGNKLKPLLKPPAGQTSSCKPSPSC